MAMLNRKINGHGRGIFREYAAYSFRKNEQDPVLDTMKTVMELEIGLGRGAFQKAAEQTGLSRSTFDSWWTKCSTQKPQYTSIAAFARGLGYDIALIKSARRNTKEWQASGPKIIDRK